MKQKLWTKITNAVIKTDCIEFCVEKTTKKCLMMEKRPTVGVKYIQLKEQYVENAKMRVFDAGKYKVAEVK